MNIDTIRIFFSFRQPRHAAITTSSVSHSTQHKGLLTAYISASCLPHFFQTRCCHHFASQFRAHSRHIISLSLLHFTFAIDIAVYIAGRHLLLLLYLPPGFRLAGVIPGLKRSRLSNTLLLILTTAGTAAIYGSPAATTLAITSSSRSHGLRNFLFSD